MNPAVIPRPIANQLLHLAQASPEREICGLIGGRDGLPSRCYPIANAAADPGRQFLLDAGQHIAAMKAMRERGEALFAIYHSHPHSPAIPSAADLRQAHYPGALYLIISLDTQGLLEMRGYLLGADGAVEVPLSLGQA